MFAGTYQGSEGDLSFRGGGKIPALGFGTGTGYSNRPEDVPDGMCRAFQVGYRLFDTAQVYGTEDGVGRGLAKLVADHGVERSQVFLMSKVNSNFILMQNKQQIKQSVKKSLELMQVKTLDLMLLHTPGVRTSAERFMSKIPKDDLQRIPRTPEDCFTARLEAWEVLCECAAEGLVTHIGVSNWSDSHLAQLIEHPRCSRVPELNQIENHPYHVGHQVIDYCNAKEILVQGYAPLGNGRSDRPSIAKSGEKQEREWVLDDPTLLNISSSQGCSVAQVCLRWALQRGVLPVIKSENEARLKENLEATRMKPLPEEDMERIDQLNKGQNIFLGWYDMM